jgi:iron-sulfur cluster repair protein YtfE (RIC family)
MWVRSPVQTRAEPKIHRWKDDQVADPQETWLDHLKWVHAMLRRDLQACRELAASVANGAAVDGVRGEIDSLRSTGLLYQLRVNCVQYCTVLHQHHSREDAAMFPAIRQSLPQLGPAIDRLEAEHRTVAALLDDVESATGELADAAARQRLADALTELAEHLTGHLDFEETALAPALDAWTV